MQYYTNGWIKLRWPTNLEKPILENVLNVYNLKQIHRIKAYWGVDFIFPSLHSKT